MQRIDAATLHGWLTDGHELAVLDAREEGEFGASHLFWAVPCPLSRREMRAHALLPRLSTRIVCTDDGRGLAEKLAAWLGGQGATRVAVLDGGTKGWEAAGFTLTSGVNVPSKAFGEWVAHQYGTESVSAAELKSWLDAGRDMAVLDSRTYEEFRRMSVPTAISVPGGELAYRIADLVPDPETLIVVTCAGRTRSILGAESLRRAGVPNRVVVLRNGTMGWELAGFPPERGRTERFAPGRPDGAELALLRARGFADSCGVRVIGPAELTQLESDPERCCYVLDVRDPAEFAAGHRPGSLSAPGGQLLQTTDAWIGVRHARIALLDDDGVRARMTAAWLRQMGHRDVFVVEGGPPDAAVPGVPADSVPGLASPAPGVEVEMIDADSLAAAGDATVVDLARSIDFRAGHIPGALWGLRSRLEALRDTLAVARLVVLTSPDGGLARLAVAEAKALTRAPVRVLAGGTAAWVRAAHRLRHDRGNPPDEACIDVDLRPYDRNSGVEQAMRAYLFWEIGLLQAVERDGTVAFGVPAAG
jgi:rhodanese-related sulfurtransferase